MTPVGKEPEAEPVRRGDPAPAKPPVVSLVKPVYVGRCTCTLPTITKGNAVASIGSTMQCPHATWVLGWQRAYGWAEPQPVWIAS